MIMVRSKLPMMLLILPLGLVALIVPTQSVKLGQIVAAVHAHASYLGLASSSLDPELMGDAQQHADTMATTGLNPRLPSHGNLPGQSDGQENIGYSAGAAFIGANNDIGFVLRPVDFVVASQPPATPQKGSVQQQATVVRGTTIPVAPLITATPQPDGSVYHTVSYGQSLWAIAQAYGITVERLLLLNGFADEGVTIYEGQRLLIKIPPPAITVTVSNLPSATPTMDPALVTPSVTPSATVFLSATPSPIPSLTPSPTVSVEVIRRERLRNSLILVFIIMGVFIFLSSILFRKTP